MSAGGEWQKITFPVRPAVRSRNRQRGAYHKRGDERKRQIEAGSRRIKGGGEGKGAEAKRSGAALPFWAFT